MRVLPHIKKLDDCFGKFLVRVICDCGACREIEPEALARLVGWSKTLRALRRTTSMRWSTKAKGPGCYSRPCPCHACHANRIHSMVVGRKDTERLGPRRSALRPLGDLPLIPDASAMSFRPRASYWRNSTA